MPSFALKLRYRYYEPLEATTGLSSESENVCVAFSAGAQIGLEARALPRPLGPASPIFKLLIIANHMVGCGAAPIARVG